MNGENIVDQEAKVELIFVEHQHKHNKQLPINQGAANEENTLMCDSPTSRNMRDGENLFWEEKEGETKGNF